MTEISMWDAPAAEATAHRTKQAVSLAQAAVEPLWPFLAEASTMPEFEHRLALSEESLIRSIAQVTEGDAEKMRQVTTAALRERFAQARMAQRSQQTFEASLRAAVAAEGAKTAAGDTVEWEQGDSLVTVSDGTLAAVMGYPVVMEVGNGYGEVTTLSGRISDFEPGDLGGVTLINETGATEYISDKNRIEKIVRHPQPGVTDPDQMSLFARRRVAGLAEMSDDALLTEMIATQDRMGKTFDVAMRRSMDEWMAQINAEVARRGLSGAPARRASRRTAGWIDSARAVVQNHQHETVDGVLLDATTANMLVQIHDALAPGNREKFAAMPLTKAVEVGWKVVTPKASAKTATRYCPTHSVYVGEGNQEQHDHCPVETRKAKDSTKTAEYLPTGKTVTSTCDTCGAPVVFAEVATGPFTALDPVEPGSGSDYLSTWCSAHTPARRRAARGPAVAALLAEAGAGDMIDRTCINPRCIDYRTSVEDDHEHFVRKSSASTHDTFLPGGHLGDEEPKFEVVLDGEVKGQYGTREDAEDKVDQIQQETPDAKPEIKEMAKTSALSVCPECKGDAKGCEACDGKGVKTSAVQDLLAAEAAFFHAPQAPNRPHVLPIEPEAPQPRQQVVVQQEEPNRASDEQDIVRERTAVRKHAEDIATRLDGLVQNDDLGGPTVSQPVSTRPRVMPKDHQQPTVPDAPPGTVANPEFAPVDPMTPTVGQRVQARVARLAARVRADNPTLSEDEARALATRTVMAYPEMVATKTAGESRGASGTCPVCYRENLALTKNGKIPVHNDTTRDGSPECTGSGREA